MQIQHSHHLTQAAAIQTIDRFLDELIRRAMPPGVKLTEPTRAWDGGRMTFSCKVSKGFLGTTITGTANVSEAEVILDVAIPKIVTLFVAEEKIKGEIEREMDTLFGQ